MSTPDYPIDLSLRIPTHSSEPGEGMAHLWEAAAFMLRRQPRCEFKRRIHTLLREGRVLEAYLEAVIYDHDTLAMLAQEEAATDAPARPGWRSEAHANARTTPRTHTQADQSRALASSIERIRTQRRFLDAES